MFGWILKWLTGSLGPYIMGAVGVVLAGALITAGVQGWRADHMKGELTKTRASLTKAAADNKTWHDLVFGPKGWIAYRKLVEAARQAEATHAAADLTKATQARLAAAGQSFEQGYAAGRAAGRKSCGAPDANAASLPARPAAGGVRDDDDFAALWRRGSPYVPPGGLPGSP